jgi:(p)ppGpp synthase/HD superfamily hydrolase
MGMTQVNKALVLATKAHGDQRRKYTGESYIVHPIEVVSILMDYGITDDDVLAAALLHDVLEDTETTWGMMLEVGINNTVVNLVLEVTDVSRPEDGNRALRKGLDRNHLALASPNGQNIKLADLISNTHSITKYDPGFAEIYLKEKTHLLGVLTKGDDSLYAGAWISLNDSLTMLAKDLES